MTVAPRGLRRMSFWLTQEQVRDGTKTVTRRLGWANLAAGTRLYAVVKAMGLRKGEKHDIICEIEVVSARRERLDATTDADVAREGFPGKSSAWFVQMFCKAMRCAPSDEVTRIEFCKIEQRDQMSLVWRLAGGAP